jgi:hypothetical protein
MNWISVKDQLPDEDVRVLCFGFTGSMIVGSIWSEVEKDGYYAESGEDMLDEVKMTAPLKISVYKRRPKFTELTDEEAAKLVRLIKMSSEQNGILIMKSLRASIKKALEGRRRAPWFKKFQYKWLVK